jgi:hypothetical protein
MQILLWESSSHKQQYNYKVSIRLHLCNIRPGFGWISTDPMESVVACYWRFQSFRAFFKGRASTAVLLVFQYIADLNINSLKTKSEIVVLLGYCKIVVWHIKIFRNLMGLLHANGLPTSVQWRSSTSLAPLHYPPTALICLKSVVKSLLQILPPQLLSEVRAVHGRDATKCFQILNVTQDLKVVFESPDALLLLYSP